MKRIKAIWIIDQDYILPAVLSICSFKEACAAQVKVVFCGKEGKERARQIFKELDASIDFESFNIPVQWHTHPEKKIISNRLARMHYAEQQSKEELVLLIDADTLFALSAGTLIDQLQWAMDRSDSFVIGVLDAKIAYRDHLYFRTYDSNGRANAVPHMKQKDIYVDVFGSNWWHHLKGASINNGLVAFHNCGRLIQRWKEFYLRGLQHECVNPGDDQLPLAAAIHCTDQTVIQLPEKYNSKGRVNGSYEMFHALSSSWKMQVVSAMKKEVGVSAYADLASKYLAKLPIELRSTFLDIHQSKEAYLYRSLGGRFGFKHLYEDVYDGLSKGIFVEVGMDEGKSACFLCEKICSEQKDIQFYAVQPSESPPEALNKFREILDRFRLHSYINILSEDSSEREDWEEEKVDFVFLNLGNDYKGLMDQLEFWYARLKDGGILAGYDYGSQIGLRYGDECATFAFCHKRGLSLRISFDIFIIEKPVAQKKPVHDATENIYVLEELNAEG